uniref:alpha-1,2-Mannosidase n=1 Tax=Culicoides sonorensis TaxID=179676 RepID=A0A336LEB7_CULSO
MFLLNFDSFQLKLSFLLTINSALSCHVYHDPIFPIYGQHVMLHPKKFLDESKSQGNLNLIQSNVIGEGDDHVNKNRRDKIREMMIHAWTGYKKYAWGANELRPVSKKPYNEGIFGKNEIGLTIIDAIDTLYIMGLTNEYEEAKMWIENNFTLEKYQGYFDTFEGNIRLIGSFLSMYGLTQDQMFLEKAKYVVDKILPIFETKTGIPKALIDFNTNSTKNYDYAYGGNSILSQYGSFHLEFSFLSKITGDGTYLNIVEKIRKFLSNSNKSHDLYPIYIDSDDGEWGLKYNSIGSNGDSFYEYLLKSWILSGYEDELSKNMFVSSMKAIQRHLIGTSHGNDLTYLGFLKFGELEPKMDHLSCFAGALFSLAGNTLNNSEYLKLAEKIADTCHASYVKSETGLGPEQFWFLHDPKYHAKAVKFDESRFALRPETIESYFYLYRITKNQTYRDWGWDCVLSLEKYCKTPHGYSGIKNVYDIKSDKDDIQQSFFLAETLKYLYLLYSNDSLLPLNEWVFNTEGHPLPINGEV